MDERTHFRDRAEAGRMLADRLADRPPGDVIVYALPRGGVPVAFEIARALNAPLELLLVRKISAPHYPELALGAVVDGHAPMLVVNEDVQRQTGATDAYLRGEEARELAEIERRRRLYFGERKAPDPAGKTAIIVDDGLATGATARVAAHALRRQGAGRIILAVPVAPPDTACALRSEVDELICLLEPRQFWGVGAFYGDFHQLDDGEVLALLERSKPFGEPHGAG